MSIGSILAQSGANMGSVLGSGMSGLGSAAEGMLTTVGQGINRRGMEKEATQLLAANKDNPAALMEAARKFAIQGNREYAEMFQKAAQAAQATLTSKKADIKREAQLKRATQVARETSDEKALVALEAGALDPAEYLSGRATQEPVDKYKVVGNRVFDVELGEFVGATDKPELLPIGTLEKVVTPESLLEYVRTGDKEVLQLLDEEKGLSTDQITSRLLSADNTLQTIKEAANLTEDIYPLFYDITKYAPGTSARQLSGRVETLKSVLAFDRLQKMRDESKTGGALGNVSNIELGLLASNLAALDPASGDFAKQLEKIEMHYNNFKNALLGVKPSGDKYVEDGGVLYYVQDDGNYVNLGKF